MKDAAEHSRVMSIYREHKKAIDKISDVVNLEKAERLQILIARLKKLLSNHAELQLAESDEETIRFNAAEWRSTVLIMAPDGEPASFKNSVALFETAIRRKVQLKFRLVVTKKAPADLRDRLKPGANASRDIKLDQFVLVQDMLNDDFESEFEENWKNFTDHKLSSILERTRKYLNNQIL